MRKTIHFQQRTSQRGIPHEIAHLVYTYGEAKGDKLILNKKSIQSILQDMGKFRQTLMKALDKGGVVVVAADDMLITTYGLYD